MNDILKTIITSSVFVFAITLFYFLINDSGYNFKIEVQISILFALIDAFILSLIILIRNAFI